MSSGLVPDTPSFDERVIAKKYDSEARQDSLRAGA